MDNMAFVRHLYEEVRRASPDKTVFDVLNDVEKLVERMIVVAGKVATDAPKASAAV